MGPAPQPDKRKRLRKGLGMNKKWLVYGGIFLAGVVLANKVRALPGLSKLPTL